MATRIVSVDPVEPSARQLILEGLESLDDRELLGMAQRVAGARHDRISEWDEWDRPLMLAYIVTGHR